MDGRTEGKKEGRGRERKGGREEGRKKRKAASHLCHVYACFHISYYSNNIFIMQELPICIFILSFRQKLFKKKMFPIFFSFRNFYTENKQTQNCNLLNNVLILRLKTKSLCKQPPGIYFVSDPIKGLHGQDLNVVLCLGDNPGQRGRATSHHPHPARGKAVRPSGRLLHPHRLPPHHPREVSAQTSTGL